MRGYYLVFVLFKTWLNLNMYLLKRKKGRDNSSSVLDVHSWKLWEIISLLKNFWCCSLTQHVYNDDNLICNIQDSTTLPSRIHMTYLPKNSYGSWQIDATRPLQMLRTPTSIFLTCLTWTSSCVRPLRIPLWPHHHPWELPSSRCLRTPLMILVKSINSSVLRIMWDVLQPMV